MYEHRNTIVNLCILYIDYKLSFDRSYNYWKIRNCLPPFQSPHICHIAFFDPSHLDINSWSQNTHYRES